MTSTVATESKKYHIPGVMTNLNRVDGANGPFYTGTIAQRGDSKPDLAFKIDGKHFDTFDAKVKSGDINDKGVVVFWGAFLARTGTSTRQVFGVLSIDRKRTSAELGELKAAKAARIAGTDTSAKTETTAKTETVANTPAEATPADLNDEIPF